LGISNATEDNQISAFDQTVKAINISDYSCVGVTSDLKAIFESQNTQS
jgi:hypothetical protein